MPSSITSSAPPTGTQSVCRALSVLVRLATIRTGASVTELAQAEGLNVSTASRLLGALQAYGFVVQDITTQRVQVGPRCFQLGQVFLGQAEVASVAEPFMRSLTDRTGYPTHLGVLSENRLVHIKHVEPVGHMLRLSPGERFGLSDLYYEALGKALLAFQPDATIRHIIATITFKKFTPTTIESPDEFWREIAEIRKRGYAIDNGERYKDVRCVAVPVWDHEDRAAAALSISGSDRQLPPATVRELGKELIEIAQQISHRIGASSLKTESPEQQLPKSRVRSRGLGEV